MSDPDRSEVFVEGDVAGDADDATVATEAMFAQLTEIGLGAQDVLGAMHPENHDSMIAALVEVLIAGIEDRLDGSCRSSIRAFSAPLYGNL